MPIDIMILSLFQSMAIIALIVLVIVGATVLKTSIRPAAPFTKRPTKRKVDAKATVLNIRPGQTSGSKSEVNLQIFVQPERGRCFLSELNVLFCFADSAGIREGSVLHVRFNSQCYDEIMLVKAHPDHLVNVMSQ